MIRFAFLALCLGCSQAEPTIIAEPKPASQPETVLKETEPPPPPGTPPKPEMGPTTPDGIPLFDPPLPPGMTRDPNLVTIEGMYTQHCGECHGKHGGGTKNAPNFLATPQLLHQDPLELRQKLIAGHGGAPSTKGLIEEKHLEPVLEHLRGRVGQERALLEAQGGLP